MESQEETVRQSLLQSFGAAIRSPFVPFDQVYLGGSAQKASSTSLICWADTSGLKPNMTTWRSTFVLLGSIAATEHQAENVRIVSEAKIVLFMMIRINL